MRPALAFPGPRVALILATLTVFGAVWLSYAPGLAGGFLFDDENNLRSLGAYGPVDDGLTLLYYLTSGIADYTGRPLAVASFLIDARDWPADPYPFKRTNLVLHLLNGALLMAVIARLEARLGGTQDASRARWVALLAAGCWMAHPFFVSTTLYVVQRHAMLPLTFVLAAILCWDKCVTLHLATARRSAWLWGTLGVGGCFLAAVLAKPNGLLAPLLVLFVYGWFHRPLLEGKSEPAQRAVRANAIAMLVVPAALTLLALASRAPSDLDYTGGRDFTFLERLLTQPRALMDYLVGLAIPRMGGGGLFVEDFAKSTSLLDPPSTLAAMLVVAALIAFAVLGRKRWPVAAFATAFYFAAHLIESSVIMLELYFEHRNYLPAAFLFWPLARVIVQGKGQTAARLAGGTVLLLMLMLLTAMRAGDWGDPSRLARLSVAHRPDSIRAQIALATQPAPGDTPHQAADRLAEALDRLGPDAEGAFNLVGAECRAGGLSERGLDHVRAALTAETHWHHQIIGWLRTAMGVAVQGQCRGLDLDVVERWLDLAEQNRAATGNPTRRQNMAHLRGVLALRRGEPERALLEFNRALAIEPNPDTALMQAAALGDGDVPDLGLRHLRYYRELPRAQVARLRSMQELHGWLLETTGYYQREFEHLETALREAAEEAATRE